MQNTTLYHPINEEAARRARQAWSMSDYVTGTTTRDYRAQVDEVVALAEKHKAKLDDADDIAKVEAMVKSYARKLADWYNTMSRIDAMCPSVLIAGPSNFPVRKKEKQNAAHDRHMRVWDEIQSIKERIKTIGMGGIKAADADAIGKLTRKVEALEAQQAEMKAANAYYRKRHTMAGYKNMTEAEAQEADTKIKAGYSWDQQPYPGYLLTNNNANIRRIRERIAVLERAKAKDTTEQIAESAAGAVRVVENTEAMRIQLFFPDKPSADVRGILKAQGFRWAPTCGAWQRQLNSNGKYAAQRVLEKLG